MPTSEWPCLSITFAIFLVFYYYEYNEDKFGVYFSHIMFKKMLVPVAILEPNQDVFRVLSLDIYAYDCINVASANCGPVGIDLKLQKILNFMALSQVLLNSFKGGNSSFKDMR